MKAVIDLHVLIRALVQSPNDTQQNELAAQVFIDAEEIIIPTHVLCELVWVLRSLYALCNEKIAALIEHLLSGDEKLNLRDDAVEAGAYAAVGWRFCRWGKRLRGAANDPW
jgi:predicted nucleic-acid-binding protein